MGDFVKGVPVRLDIGRGRFIDVRKRLNTGEHQAYLNRMMPYQTPGEKPRLETLHVLTGKVLSYLLGWSLTDDGRPVPYDAIKMSEEERLAVLSNLDPDVFREIREAIEAHEEREDQAREAEKNAPAGEHKSPETLPSSNSTASLTTMS